MASPFPGMDPYLERHWRDVHTALIAGARAQLNRTLPAGMKARAEERLVVEEPWEESRSIYPDVQVIEHSWGDGGAAAAAPAADTAVADALIISLPEPTRQRFIEIIDPASDGKVITVIEFVSPANKLGGDAEKQYRRKRDEVIAGGINLVEIDLTRSGERNAGYAAAQLPPDYRNAAYLTCVFRATKRRFEVYRMPLRERLRTIRIPLRERDDDVTLELQPLVDRAYEDGRYNDIDYSRPCVPPLEREDAAWAAGLSGRAV